MARMEPREIQVERLTLREPNGGRIRAILETAPSRNPDADSGVPVVRLSLLSPTGEVALVAEVDETGEPQVFVGNPDRGTTVIIGRQAIDHWHGGNIVASLMSTGEGGKLELRDADGSEILNLPRSVD